MWLWRLQPIHIICVAFPTPAKGTQSFQASSYTDFAIKNGYLVRKKVGSHGAEMAAGNSWQGADNSVSALRIIQSLFSLGCVPLLLSPFLNISPKPHHFRNTEFLPLSALFWLHRQSLTVKLGNKAKAAGTWQQSSDAGTNLVWEILC